LLEDELFEKVWPRESAISGISVISVLFMFRCLILQEGDFPAILRTTDQTFFIKVRLLILETYVCQECRLDVLITRLVWARIVFNIVLCRVLFHPFKGFVPGFNGCFSVFVAPDGIMFFGIWFAFWAAIICYVDDNIRILLNRILCTADSVSAEFQSCLM